MQVARLAWRNKWYTHAGSGAMLLLRINEETRRAALSKVRNTVPHQFLVEQLACGSARAQQRCVHHKAFSIRKSTRSVAAPLAWQQAGPGHPKSHG